jgi:predicted ATPase
MRTRRRIALALCTTKSPLSESERSFIQSVVYNTRGDILTFGSNSFLFSLGARKTRESDIENCVSVCIEIREHIQGIKFGVSYGLVSVDERKDGSIKIESPITKKVKHLESIAATGQISTDDSIIKIYSRIFDIRHIKTKGKDVYNIFGFKGKPSRIRGLREAYGRMIGRDKEFNTLQNFILQTASDHGMIVGVVGEAGIGKTRITHELKTLIKMRGLRFYEGSFPYFGGSSYKGFKDIISQIASISPSDPINTIDQKLRRIKSKYNLEDSDINFLVNLYSVIPVSETLKHLNEEQLRLGTFVAVKKLLFTIAESPLVIILEDMQNADELSVELANFLCEGIPDKKLLFFMNYRPEFKGKFEENVYFNRIKLERFDEAKAKELLTSLLDISNVPKNLLKLIIKKSAGNPLFIEELVRSLLDKGKIKVINNELQLSGDIKAEDIQPTVHGVISYRMEKLEPGTRKALQWASAAGDEINVKLLKAILIPPPSRGGAKGEGDIPHHIETLETRDFIVEKSIYPEEIYRFRHDLIREVAYESLSSSTKKNMHLKIGQYLENKFKKEIDEHVEEIANHYIASSDHHKGFEYAFKAAEKLKKNYANEEAIELYRTSLNLLGHIKGKDSDRYLQKIYNSLKDIHTMTGAYEKAFSILKEYKSRIKSDNNRNLAVYNRMIGEVYWRKGYYDEAISHTTRSLELFDQLGLKQEKIKSLNILLGIYSLTCDNSMLKQCADQLLQIISPDDKFDEANLYYRLGQLYFNEGSYDKALDLYWKSLKISEKLDDISFISHLNNMIANALYYKGDTDRAMRYYNLALKLAKETGALKPALNIHIGLGNLRIGMGDIKGSFHQYYAARDINEQAQGIMESVMIYSNLSWLFYFLGDYIQAKENLLKSNEYLKHSSSKYWQGINILQEGIIERDLKEYKKAILLINKSISLFSEINDNPHSVIALSELIDICYRTGETGNLKDLLGELHTRSKNQLSAVAKEKAFIAKKKAELILNNRMEAWDIENNIDLDKFDYENRFEAYIIFGEHTKRFGDDSENNSRYFQMANDLYNKLLDNVPVEFRKSLGEKNIYKNSLKKLLQSTNA